MRFFRQKKKNFSLSSSGQTMIEFTFSLIVVLLMIYGMMKVFEWTGKDQAMRRMAHDELLFSDIKRKYDRENPGEGPLKQIDPYFYTPQSMNAIWDKK